MEGRVGDFKVRQALNSGGKNQNSKLTYSELWQRSSGFNELRTLMRRDVKFRYWRTFPSGQTSEFQVRQTEALKRDNSSSDVQRNSVKCLVEYKKGTSYFAVWFAAIRLETVSFWWREERSTHIPPCRKDMAVTETSTIVAMVIPIFPIEMQIIQGINLYGVAGPCHSIRGCRIIE